MVSSGLILECLLKPFSPKGEYVSFYSFIFVQKVIFISLFLQEGIENGRDVF